MAGLGYKSFTSGEVLTAANLQGYAVDQSIMVFATSAARTTALAAPSQGMMSFQTDVGALEKYLSVYNASTNPGGAKTAGWYPVAGEAMFYATATRTAATGTVYNPGETGFSFTELVDTYSWHDATTNPTRITPNREGIYRATASFQWGANATGGRNAQIQKNSGDLVSAYSTGLTARNFSMTGLSYMNGSSDYFNLGFVSQDSGSSLTVICQVMVEYVRPSNV
jgi:hypothetical protein